MGFNSYIVSETKTAFSVPMPVQVLPNKKSFKQRAFTLAETLITLSIIGVVAAMTIPTLMSNMNKQTYVTGLKKAYSNIQNAVKMMPISVGCSAGDYSCVTNNASHTYADFFDGQIFAQQFKNAKDFTKCKLLYESPLGHGSEDACFQVDDGMIYMLEGSNGNYYISSLGVDINGQKGPNKLGRDIFVFELARNDKPDIVPWGTVMPYGSKKFDEYVSGGHSVYYWKNETFGCTTENVEKQANYYAGQFCAGRVLEENAMNY